MALTVTALIDKTLYFQSEGDSVEDLFSNDKNYSRAQFGGGWVNFD